MMKKFKQTAVLLFGLLLVASLFRITQFKSFAAGDGQLTLNQTTLFISGHVEKSQITNYENKASVRIIYVQNCVLPEDCSYLFTGYTNCITICITETDASQVKSMLGMFSNLDNLRFALLPNLNTTRLERMDAMFTGCTNLRAVQLHGLDTHNVKSMVLMFAMCRSLTSLDLSFLTVSKDTMAGSMFLRCPLSYLELGSSFCEITSIMHLNGNWKRASDGAVVYQGNGPAVFKNNGNNVYRSF